MGELSGTGAVLADRAAVVSLPWASFLGWRAGDVRRYETAWGETVRLPAPPVPGQHEANIGPTGEGKTNYLIPLLKLRKYVMVLDAKGEDPTLDKAGFTRISGVPPGRKFPREVQKALDEGRPVRLIVGGAADSRRQYERLAALMAEALEYARFSGGWTIYADEFEVLSSQQMFNLARDFNLMLNTARARKTSVITAYQAQAWVSKHAIRQARIATLWRTGDPDMIKAVARALGRNWRHAADAIDQLPPFTVLVIPRGANSGPMMITRPPKL